MPECWLPVVGHPDYEVSDQGRVRRDESRLPQDLFGAVLAQYGTDLETLYTVDWEGTPVHIDEIRKHLQQVADGEEVARKR